MHDIGTSTRLVGLAGSLRKACYSRASLLGLREHLPAGIKLEICDLQLSLYNEDEDAADAPHDVRLFRNVIGASDGVAIATSGRPSTAARQRSAGRQSRDRS